jgi:hypothetical protein
MHGNAPVDTPAHGNAVNPGRRLYNSKQARELLGGISERKFRQLTASGRLVTKKDEGRVFVEQSSIDAYIDSLPSGAAAQPEQDEALSLAS